MHTSIVHATPSPLGLTQMAAPQADRIPGKSRSDHATDLINVFDRVTINRAQPHAKHPAIEQMYGRSAFSPAHFAKADGRENVAAGCHLAHSWRNWQKIADRGDSRATICSWYHQVIEIERDGSIGSPCHICRHPAIVHVHVMYIMEVPWVPH